jgi:ribokinase
MSPTVAVLGAINVDLVVRVPALPKPGITVTGGTFSRHQGGKGGNQAVAASRALGEHGRVVMLGCVGEDDLGREAVQALRHERIDVSGVATTSEAPTGVALIAVDEDGENQIAVAPGANLRCDPDVVLAHLEGRRPDLVLMSLEASPDATAAAAEWCHGGGVPLLLNPAPVQSWARDLLVAASWLTPNEHELDALVPLPDGLIVLETLGADGAAILIPGAAAVRVAAPTVDAVDSTGAGDCLNGVLAAGLVEGLDVVDAARRAIAAAALAVTVHGAREGMPTRERIDRAVS